MGLSKLKQLIKQCNSVLSTLDKLEENRPLYPPEFNFRKILKKHILKMLQNQKEYWRKRYTVRWTKFGDESTKKFHAAATERYRLNTITSLDTLDGRTVSDHHGKASLLWEEYKARLDCSTQTHMFFNIQDLVQQHDLHHIETPFTREDIDSVVERLPTDKAPGPDGFNGLFIKKAWHIIKEDIYQLCFDFFNGAVDIQSINTSFITLIPKVNSPSGANDFRPISLINCVVKIITKLMGERLQSVIIPLVHQNQYGFIKSMTIQDCLAWAFEYIHQCQQSKQEILIIKLDFTKAFYTIEHSTIILIMKQLGFSESWLQWTASILSSASTSVLLNGVLGKSLNCRRGGQTWRPNVPLLFVLAADLLQCVINRAHSMGLLQLPIPSYEQAGFPIIQYVDDTIILLKASQMQLLCLKSILETFAQSIGLRVNYSKSGLVPLNMTTEKAEIMAGVFGCHIQEMPFTYLGLPMGIARPRVEHFEPIMNRMERHLTSISSLLTHAGRLKLVNSVLSASPTYTMCSVSVPLTVHEYFDSLIESGGIACEKSQTSTPDPCL
jgi:hypothetical protein